MKKTLFLLSILFICMRPVSLNAQTHSSFFLSPLSQKLTGQSGNIMYTSVNINSISSDEQTFSIISSSFSVSPEGKVTIGNDLSGRSASQWVSAPETIKTLPNQEVNVPIKIVIPSNTAPGEYFAAIVVQPIITNQSSLPNSATQVAVRIGSLFSIRVSGDAKEAVTISQLYYSHFQEQGPLSVRLMFSNNGDYQITPRGETQVTDIFGRKTIYSLPQYNIFPGNTRQYALLFPTSSLINRYTLVISAAYGEQGHSITRTITIWIIPWKIITVTCLTLLFILVIYTERRRRSR